MGCAREQQEYPADDPLRGRPRGDRRDLIMRATTSQDAPAVSARDTADGGEGLSSTPEANDPARGPAPRVLVVTQIFPNAVEREYAPYNRQQFAALARACSVDVLATVPWFPGARAMRAWSRAGRLVDLSEREEIDGLEVRHPRFFFIPKVPALLGPLYVASLAPVVLALAGCVDVLLGSYAYPDGFATVVLAAMLGVPAVVKLHGGDLDVSATAPAPRRLLQWALPRAAGVVAVSQKLVEKAVALGVPRERVHLVQNGVDRARFHPRDRAAARAALGLQQDRRLILYVGRIEKDKGVLDLIEAFAELRRAQPDVDLVLLGDGSAMGACRAAVASQDGAVRLLGALGHDDVARWMAASDIVTLPSWHEGTPNVIIEALASGRRVVASDVGGIPALIHHPALGEMVPPRKADALAAALGRAVREPYDADEVSRLCGRGAWTDSAQALEDVLRGAIDEHAARRA
jgi:teichuronic acid biosynthesis glycosyltransferase TuaC